ncbi:hypothetical protein BDV19DRAFT_368589 [Aspergillus venezuelensis]
MLLKMSELPNATRSGGWKRPRQPLTLQGQQVWRDMPILGWAIREEWRDLAVSEDDTPNERERNGAI